MTATSKFRVGLALCAGVGSASATACLAQHHQADEASDTAKVTGGYAIDSSLMPTVVAVKVADFAGDDAVSTAYCTGVLISTRHVLTNAHCFLPVTAADDHAKVISRTHVFFDTEDNRAAPAVDVMAADITLHDDFALPAGQALGYADLAVITLATAMPDRVASPISFDAADAPVGGELIVAGYGLYNSSGASGVLHRLVDTSTSCARATESDEEYICIDRADRSGPASGDSGAAIFVERAGVPTVVGTHTYSLIGGGANPNFALAQRASLAYYQDFLAGFGDDVACAHNTVCNEACGALDLDCQAAPPGGGGGEEPTEPPCVSCEPAVNDEDADAGGCQANGQASPLAALGAAAAIAWLARRRRAKTSA